jgi:hypothetical protein
VVSAVSGPSAETAGSRGVPGGGDVLRLLARPATDADRRRARLVVTGVSGAGAFLLAAIGILSVSGDSHGGSSDPTGLAPYVAQAGLRAGTAFGSALLVIPFILFGLQALRTGTAARERRLATLSLVGATRVQLRRLAFLEGTRAAALGGLLAGPVYLLLWLLTGVLVPRGWRLLPGPGPAVGIGWVVLLAVLSLGGGLSARLAARPASVSPLGITRRARRDIGAVGRLVPGVALAVAVAATLGFLGSGDLIAYTLLAALLVLTVTGGAWIVELTGRLALRRGLATAMAGRRMLADVRGPGRVAGVLFAIGIAFGATTSQIISVWIDSLEGQSFGDSVSFYVAGELLAAAGGLLATVVAIFSLVVGATEQVLDSRRATAILVALAASPGFVVGVVRRQLLLASLPAALLGAVLGWVFGGIIQSDGTPGWSLLLSLPAALLLTGLSAGVGALVAARAVKPAVLESSDPANLRVP